MTDRELMQQALEALDCIFWPLHLRELNKVVAAMNALRERLAQPEQEPVAWWNPRKDTVSCDPVHRHHPDCTPLYTAPPQSKPLTEEEIADEWEHVTGHNISHGDRQEGRAMYISPDEVAEFARAVIAKATAGK